MYLIALFCTPRPPGISRLLLEKGADPNTPRGGSPILFDSANRGDIEAEKLLITYGANISAVDDCLSTSDVPS